VEAAERTRTVIELAAALGRSPFHLPRLLPAVAGLSLRRYLLRLRAILAAERPATLALMVLMARGCAR
jgi:AraC-like DNA-binding protein